MAPHNTPAVRQGPSQRLSRRDQGQEPVRPDRRHDCAEPDDRRWTCASGSTASGPRFSAAIRRVGTRRFTTPSACRRISDSTSTCTARHRSSSPTITRRWLRRRQQLDEPDGWDCSGITGSRQSNYNLTGSITKSRGSWTHKAGVEGRDLQSNYHGRGRNNGPIGGIGPRGRQFQFPVRDGERRRQRRRTPTTTRRASTAPHCCWALPPGGSGPGANVLPALLAEVFRGILAE